MNTEYMKFHDMINEKYPGSADRQIGEMLGISQSYAQMIRTGQRDISKQMANKIHENSGKLLSREKLIYGDD